MEFAFTDEQAMIAETAQQFFATNATSERTRKAMAGDGIDQELWTAFCHELGLAGVAIAEDHGGAGLGQVEFALLAEAAGAHVAALPMLGLAMASGAIAAGGSPEQKALWLSKLACGEVVAACAGTHELEANGNKLSGRFEFVAHGGIANIFVLGDDRGAWIVSTSAAGLTIDKHTTMDQTRPFATLTLDNVSGEPLSDGPAAMQAARDAGWLCISAEALGGAQAAPRRCRPVWPTA